MARTVDEIYSSIITEKNTMSSLQALLPNVDDLPLLIADLGNSPSRVAIWRLWVYIMAVCVWTHENLWDQFRALIESIIANKEPGTLRWYQQQAFSFQYGDPLVWINNKYQYATIDITKRNVNRCAAIEANGGGIVIKAANNVGGVTYPLAAPVLTAFSAYYQKIKYAGPPITCVSYDPDRLRLLYTVYFDPLADKPTVIAAVESAIITFISQLVFNGIFNLTKLTDAIEAVPGVSDVRITSAEWTYGALAFTLINGEYQTRAGYCMIDPAYPLSTTITYLPYA